MNNIFLKAAKKAAVFVVSIILALTFIGCDKDKKEQYPTPTEKFFVNDFAAVMTDADINTIYTAGAALNEATTAQAVVVTVETLDGKDASEYALELGRQWGVGAKDDDNGVVILFSEGDREIYISVGYGLEGALPDSKTGRIIDTYGIPYFSSNKFSAGLVDVYNAIVNEIYIEYGLTPQENYIPVDLLPQTQNTTESLSDIAISWLILIVLVMLYTSIFGRRGGLFIFGSPRFFTRGFYGGGFSGSSGGFSGFKGGGGSFGGGGAGRRF